MNACSQFFLPAFLVLCLTSITSAAVVVVPELTTYVPGESIELRVELPAISNLASYTIDVLVDSPGGVAGVDFDIDESASGNDTGSPVFVDATNFDQFVGVDAGRLFYSVGNFIDPDSTDITPGVNDVAAVFTLTTEASLSGPLSISIDADNLILDQPGLPFQSVDGFDGIIADTVAIAPVVLTAVPEPSVVAGLVFVIGSFGSRRRR